MKEEISKIPHQEENPKGLHQRFYLQKIVPTREQNFFGQTRYKRVDVNPEAEYFVLRLDENGRDPNHIRACRKAINTYAEAIKDFIPELSADLIKRYPLIPQP